MGASSAARSTAGAVTSAGLVDPPQPRRPRLGLTQGGRPLRSLNGAEGGFDMDMATKKTYRFMLTLAGIPEPPAELTDAEWSDRMGDVLD